MERESRSDDGCLALRNAGIDRPCPKPIGHLRILKSHANFLQSRSIHLSIFLTLWTNLGGDGKGTSGEEKDGDGNEDMCLERGERRAGVLGTSPKDPRILTTLTVARGVWYISGTFINVLPTIHHSSVCHHSLSNSALMKIHPAKNRHVWHQPFPP